MDLPAGAPLVSGNPGDELGTSVDMVNNRAAIGAPSPSGNGYVVTASLVAGVWQVSPGSNLTPPSPQAGERFGDAVAMAGDLLVVGAPRHDQGVEPDAGRVLVFEWTSSGWQDLQQLTQPGGPEALARFGDAVDLWQDPADPDHYRLIVGAPNATHSFGGVGDSGKAFILSSTDGGSNWTTEASLELPLDLVPSAGDSLGQSVAIEADLAVVGAPFYTRGTGSGDRGLAVAAVRDGTWSILSDVPDDWDDQIESRELGSSVAVRDGLIAVGAPGDVVADGFLDTALGTLRLARVVGTSVTEIDRVIPDTGSGDLEDLEGLRFGDAVVLFGDAVAVAASATGPGALLAPRVEIHLLDAGGFSRALAASVDGAGVIATTLSASINGDGLPSLALGVPGGTADPGSALLLRGPLPTGGGLDENANGIIDVCEIAAGLADDCDGDCRIDLFQIAELPGLDCNDNDLLDSCELTTAEIVWVIDGSASTGGKADAICEDLIPLLEAQLTAAGLNVRSLVLGVGENCNAVPCLDAGQSVEGLYGTSVPLPDNGTNYGAVSMLDGCESWAAATAIVAHSHPWDGALRIVIPIADECAWEGGDVPANCDALDDLSIEAAGLFADCRDVFVLPIQTPDLNGSLFGPTANQMAEIASLTSGVRFQLPDLNPATVASVRAGLETAIRTRSLVHDFDPYVPDGQGGATAGNGILDTCEIGSDPGAFPDCNGNGINDTLEILLGDPTWERGDPADTTQVISSADLDGNGLLDLCEAACCPGDQNRNGFVDFDDLLIVLADYTTPSGGCGGAGDPFTDFCDPATFPAGPCPGDVNGDGDTDFNDLLIVLSSFDSCFVQGAPPCAVIRRGVMPAPQSVLDCLQRAGWDPVKAAACIDALNLVGSQP